MTLTAMSVLLAVTLTFFSIASGQEASEAAPVDIKGKGKELVNTIRDLTARAKDGVPTAQLEKEVLQIQTTLSDLLGVLPENATDCEIQSVVKMAAAGVGSHEVLKLLTANDAMAVLDGRLALSLAVLDQMAQQLEDELTLSKDVGPILAAIVFAAKTTVDIIETADATVNEVMSLPQDGSDAADDASDDKSKDDKGDGVKARRSWWWPTKIPIPRPYWPPIITRSVWQPWNPRPWDNWPKPGLPNPTFPDHLLKRNSEVNVPWSKQSHGSSEVDFHRPKVPGSRGRSRRQGWSLGGGWNVGLGGLSWQSSSGNANFNVKPTFGGGGLGVSAGFSFRF